MSAWQYQRSKFNHDWLKNTFIIQLGALRNLASAKQNADGELIEACQSAFREWYEHRLESRELIDAFRREESPKTLFSIPPLSNCDNETQSWLPDFIHQHWLTTHPVEIWIHDALNAWKEADEQAGKLRVTLGQSDLKAEMLAVLVNDFRLSVSELSDAISRFPSHQLIEPCCRDFWFSMIFLGAKFRTTGIRTAKTFAPISFGRMRPETLRRRSKIKRIATHCRSRLLPGAIPCMFRSR
jgi:hypothetical protein